MNDPVFEAFTTSKNEKEYQVLLKEIIQKARALRRAAPSILHGLHKKVNESTDAVTRSDPFRQHALVNFHVGLYTDAAKTNKEQAVTTLRSRRTIYGKQA